MEGTGGTVTRYQRRPVLRLCLLPLQVMTFNVQLTPSATKLHLSLALER